MSSKKAPKNKYVTNSHLSERKFRELLRLFCADVTALSAASLTGLNRNTVNRCYGLLRVRIAEICEADSPFDGEVEADESYFGARLLMCNKKWSEGTAVGILDRIHPMLLGPNPCGTAWGSCNPGRPLS